MKATINLLHYLDDDGLIDVDNINDPALAIFLSAIVESASANYRLPLTMADAECLGTHKNELCLGEVETWIYAENNDVGWECLRCGEIGAISNWEGSRWDRRDSTNH